MYRPKNDSRGWWGEPPRPDSTPIQFSKGYPSRQDPQAEAPQGVMKKNLSESALRRMQQKYSKKL